MIVMLAQFPTLTLPLDFLQNDKSSFAMDTFTIIANKFIVFVFKGRIQKITASIKELFTTCGVVPIAINRLAYKANTHL